jgi:hypothetical protein
MTHKNLQPIVLLIISLITLIPTQLISQVPALPEVHPDSIKRFTLKVAVPLSKIWLKEMTDNACEVNLSVNQRALISDAPARVIKGGISGDYLLNLPGSTEILHQDSIIGIIRRQLCTQPDEPNCKYDHNFSYVYTLSFQLEQHGPMLLYRPGDFDLIASYKVARKDQDSIRVDKHILSASLQEIILKDWDYRKAIQLQEYDWIPAFISSEDGKLKRRFCCDAASSEMIERMKQKNGKSFEDFVKGLSVKDCD